MMPLAALALSACLALGAGADHIVIGDLASALPALASLEPSTPLAPAPAPGVARVFHVPELRRMALRLGWPEAPAADICVERPVTPPDPAKLLAAMQAAVPEARIAILDYSRQQLPEGTVEFPVSGLQPGGGPSALWTGYVLYGTNRRFCLWARVNVRVTLHRVVATADLRPGQAIAPEQLRAETSEGFPARENWLASIEDAAGRWPRVPIRAGMAIGARMLETPRDVMRGQTVHVEVRSGAAHLEFEALAEASGSAGDTVAICNPDSRKRFLARVEGKGRVSVNGPAAKVNP
jgi:flagella basal body P-ring formation protein FlgA